jgi:hypothetical protein
VLLICTLAASLLNILFLEVLSYPEIAKKWMPDEIPVAHALHIFRKNFPLFYVFGLFWQALCIYIERFCLVERVRPERDSLD